MDLIYDNANSCATTGNESYLNSLLYVQLETVQVDQDVTYTTYPAPTPPAYNPPPNTLYIAADGTMYYNGQVVDGNTSYDPNNTRIVYAPSTSPYADGSGASTQY